MEQILKKTTTDSLGNFNYEGNNLINENRFYRIHLDECHETVLNSGHFFGSFEISKSILFKTKRQFEGRNKATFSVDFEYPSRASPYFHPLKSSFNQQFVEFSDLILKLKIMKSLFLFTFFLFTATIISSQKINQEISIKNQQPFLLGEFNMEGLSSNSYKEWFQPNSASYSINTANLQQ